MPPRLRASDYAKGKISQDEIISLQIANDANISRARKAIKLGEIPQKTEMETASTMELLADDAAQEATARTNVMKLGFRDREAAAIITNIRGEANLDFATFNANFPAIEADVKKRFNVKLITPTFFIEYLKKYSDELADANGVKSVFNPNNAGVNNLVNTIAELRQVIPDPNVIEYIKRAAQESRVVGQDTLNQLDYLKGILPDAGALQSLANLDPVRQQRIIDQLLVQFADMPSEAEIRRLASKIEADQIDRASFQKQILEIINSIPTGRQANIVEKETGSSSSSASVATLTYNEQALGRKMSAKEKKAVDDFSSASGRAEMERTADELVSVFGNQDASRIMGALAQKLRVDAMGNRFDAAMVDISSITGDTATTTQTLGSAMGLDTATLQAIKATFRANPDLATKLINSATGQQVNYNDLQKTEPKGNSRKVWIQDTNIREIFQEKFGRGLRGKISPNIKLKVGRGLAVKETPSYREYGKYAIHIPQLEQQDILNVKYKSLGQIPKFKPIPVSDIFRDFVLDLIENGKPNARVYTQICPNERKFFEEMSIGAGIWNSLGLKRTTTSTDEEENKRFELLKGEYIAGNNSPKVISELRKLVVKMMSDGRIRKNQGVELLMELSI
jgi:hypothetical protein